MTDRTYGFATLAVHAGAEPDPTTGARAVPIYQTTSYVFDDVDHAAALFNLQKFGNIYTRLTNPTVSVLESRIAALEGGTAGCCTASGHAAQFLTFLNLLRPGNNVVSSSKLYGGSITQMTHTFPQFGWEARFVDPREPRNFAERIDAQTRALFVESVSNPDGIVADIEAIAAIAHTHGAAAGGRQHPAHPLPLPAAAMGGRHRRPLHDQISGRPGQLGRRRHRRGRPVRLGQRQVPAAGRADRGLSRPALLRDLRQLRVRPPQQGDRPARHGPRPLALQRLPDPAGHRDPAPAHGPPRRQRRPGRRLARLQPPRQLGLLPPPAAEPHPAPGEVLPARPGLGVHHRRQGRLRRWACAWSTTASS